MADLLSALKEWQSLAGAIVGAIASLSVAFLVAYVSRRREDVSAALVLVGSLTNVLAAHRNLTEIASKEGIIDSDYPAWLAGQLAAYRPKLSPLFDGCVATVMPIQVSLAAHLELFGVAYRGVDEWAKKIEDDAAYFQKHGKLFREKADLIADAKLIENGLSLAAKHAECAERLIGVFVLSKWRVWHRARYFFWKTPQECECRRVLEIGEL